MCALMQLAALGVQDAPTGPLSGCPCCHGAQGIHINVDFCFQLCHLQRCGTSGVQLAPPNQQLYIDSAAASALLSSAGCRSADAAESDSAPCSDFDAAQALGRTSEKVRGMLYGGVTCATYKASQLWLIIVPVQVRAHRRVLPWPPRHAVSLLPHFLAV